MWRLLWLCCLLALAQPSTAQVCSANAAVQQQTACTPSFRVGVLNNNPPYSQLSNATWQGFEIELSQLLATRLGLAVQFVPVTPANRIAYLGERRIDLAVAAIGHTTLRDAEALFIRPHYYQTQTVVIGRTEIELDSINQIRGRAICVSLGSSSNAELSEHGARLILFDNSNRLLEALRSGACSLAAQEESFFAVHWQTPSFAAALDVKFGFSPLNWGMAVARTGNEALAEKLGLALRQLHASGELQALAKKHGVDSPFFKTQAAVWTDARCNKTAFNVGWPCELPPIDTQLAPTSFVGTVIAIEQAVQARLGLKLTLAMFKTEVAFTLFLTGLAFSIALVFGTILSTLLCAAAFATALGSRLLILRWPAQLILWVMQSTPLVLLMILAGVLLTAAGDVTASAAFVAACLVIGLTGGSNAGQAWVEARAQSAVGDWRRTLRKAAPQLLAFVASSTRGSPVAALIGVPELLSALTDIASFSSERVTTYSFLLLFYLLMVNGVIYLFKAAVRRILKAAHA
jgi:polar amino acid transport system substrate-binding protein